MLPAERKCGTNQGGDHDTFVVILQRNGVAARSQFPDGTDQVLYFTGGDVGRNLSVDSGNVLVPSHNPCLYRSRTVFQFEEASCPHPKGDEVVAKELTFRIGPDSTHNLTAGPESYHIGGNVPCPAQSPPLGFDPNDRYGRFRGDPIHRTGQITVEHEVSDHQDSGL
jgi:hypothetical protein